MKRILLLLPAIAATVSSYAQCSCGSSSSGIAYGENGSRSLTLKKNKWLAESYSEHRAFKLHHDHEFTEEGGHTHDSTVVENELRSTFLFLSGIRYGLTDNITLSVQQPYLWLSAEPQSTNGAGDLMFISTIKLFEKTDFTGAIIAGIKFPTGKKSTLNNETNSVIGSGSFDPIGGIALTKSYPKSFIRLNVFYKHSTIGYDKTNFGSFFSHTFSFGYKLKEKEENCITPACSGKSCTDAPVCTEESKKRVKQNSSWNITGGVSGELSNPQLHENNLNENSGGYSLFFQSGTTVGLNTWSVPVTLSAPLMQALSGEQHKTNFRIRIGVVKTF